MNTETERIRDQYLRAVSGECWSTDDNLDDLLASLTVEMATQRALPHGKTIHELVEHLVYTENIVAERLRGQPASWDYEAAWLPPQARGLSWAASLTALQTSRRAFLAELDGMTDDRLDQPVAAGLSSAYLTLHGHIQHTLYHLGQIAMLRSLLSNA